MNSLSNQLKTHHIDPRYHSIRRTLFRIEPNRMFLGNLRLANLGCVTSSANAKYNCVGGVTNLFKNIFLYNGKELIDCLRHANDYLSADSFNKSHSKQRSIEVESIANDMNFRLNNKYQITIDKEPANATDNINTTKECVLDLTRPLKYLNVGYLPTNLMQDLTLVIEWNTNDVLRDNADNVVSINEPVLIADELLDESKYDQIISMFRKGIQFDAIEDDRMVIEAQAQPNANQTTDQTVKARIDGFNRKIVSNVLLVTKPSARQTNVGVTNSVAQFNEGIRFTLNGKALLPYFQIDSSAIKLGLHKDIYGDSSMFWGANEYHTIANDDPYDNNKVRDLYKHLSYGAVRLNDYVQNLQVQYDRTSIHGLGKTYELLQLFLFASVRKMIMANDDGSIEVGYVQ